MKFKSRLRAGLFFGVTMAIFNIGWNLLLEDNSSSQQIFRSIASGLISGAISGLLFGWLIGIFGNSTFVNKTTRINPLPGETILFETPANHFKGIEGVGGKLYLTSKRLVFKSHKLNIQNHELSLELQDIRDVARHKTAGLLNNGLLITTTGNGTEKFVVEQAEEWVERLKATAGRELSQY